MKNAGIKAGQDTLILNNYIFTTLGTGDYINLEYTDDITNEDIASDGTLLLARNPKGLRAILTIKAPVGSDANKQLILWFNDIRNNFVSSAWLEGTYSKISYSNNGTLEQEIFQITAGSIKKPSGAKSNAEGDIEQMMRTWTISCTAIPTVS